MRTTVRIDDDMMQLLKERAHREGVSLARLINRVLRHGLEALKRPSAPSRSYREKTFRMGEPKVPLDKALALAASLEDQEIMEKLARRK